MGSAGPGAYSGGGPIYPPRWPIPTGFMPLFFFARFLTGVAIAAGIVVAMFPAFAIEIWSSAVLLALISAPIYIVFFSPPCAGTMFAFERDYLYFFIPGRYGTGRWRKLPNGPFTLERTTKRRVIVADARRRRQSFPRFYGIATTTHKLVLEDQILRFSGLHPRRRPEK